MSDWPLLMLLIGSSLADALAFLAVFLAPRRASAGQTTKPALNSTRLTIAFAAAGAVFLVKVPLLRGLGLDAFGLIRALYVDLVVAVPLLALSIFIFGLPASRVRPELRPTRIVRILAFFAILMAPVGIYASFVEPHRLQLETTTLPLPPQRAGGQPIHIGILADIQTDHVTDYERNAVARLMAQQPDLVLVAGDLFQGGHDAFQREAPALRELLCSLTAPGGAFMVLGDVDVPQWLEPLLKGTPVRLLVNETAATAIGDRRLSIAGVDLECREGQSSAFIRAFAAKPGHDDIRILLAHRPDAVLELPSDSRVDLVVSGHTHGGQVVVPFFGPPITLSHVPRRIAAGGLHELNGNHIYVSRGVGSERGQAPMLRLNCPPEIALLIVAVADSPYPGTIRPTQFPEGSRLGLSNDHRRTNQRGRRDVPG